MKYEERHDNDNEQIITIISVEERNCKQNICTINFNNNVKFNFLNCVCIRGYFYALIIYIVFYRFRLSHNTFKKRKIIKQHDTK